MLPRTPVRRHAIKEPISSRAKRRHQTSGGPMRDQVFISYSHKDAKWLERLQTMLRPLTRNGVVKVWADTQIRAGDRWREDIQQALADARVAVLLVTPDFLASDFVAEQELPSLFKAAADEGLTIVWVPIRDSLYAETMIGGFQAAYRPDRPLASLSGPDRDEALVEISKIIMAATTAQRSAPPAPAKPSRAPARTPKPAPRVPKAEQPAWPSPAKAESRPSAFTEQQAPALDKILPGTWRVQIQFAMPGAVGIMELQMFSNGQFKGELSTPMGASMVQGMWQANAFSQQLLLQGQQSNGFQTIPYGVMIQVAQFDARQLSGVSNVGEQIRFERVG